MLVKPRLPGGLGAGARGRRLFAEQIETDRQIHWRPIGCRTRWAMPERAVEADEQLLGPGGLACPLDERREARASDALTRSPTVRRRIQAFSQRFPRLGADTRATPIT